jgi:hypothetical protein
MLPISGLRHFMKEVDYCVLLFPAGLTYATFRFDLT